MPVTILNPHRSEPWAHAVQGLSGALEAFTRYKAEDRDFKLKQEEVAIRREESEQRRKDRDYLRAKQDEQDNIQIETERLGLGSTLAINKDAAEIGDMIKETTGTGFVTPPPIDKAAGLSAGTIGAAPTVKQAELGGPPAEMIKGTTNPFETEPIGSVLGEIKPGQAPLESLVAPQLAPEVTPAGRMAAHTAITDAEFATPTGKLSARERAMGRQGIEDAKFRREVGESERRERVATETRKAEWKERDEADAAREKARDERLKVTNEAAERRARINQEAALERAAIAAAKGNRDAATSADVDHLAAGGTLASIPQSRRTAAAQAARKEGLAVFETPGQQKAYQVADTSLGEAAELKRLLQSDKDVQSAFGTFAGRWNTSATSGVLSSLPGDIPNNVRRAIQLAQNLNDLRLRQRSGAAISESEAARLGKFSFDPTVPAEQMLVNIDPYIAELEAIKSGNSSSGAGSTKKKDPNDPLELDETASESGIPRPKPKPRK